MDPYYSEVKIRHDSGIQAPHFEITTFEPMNVCITCVDLHGCLNNFTHVGMGRSIPRSISLKGALLSRLRMGPGSARLSQTQSRQVAQTRRSTLVVATVTRATTIMTHGRGRVECDT